MLRKIRINSREQRGFTLIELLFVVGIIGIIAGLAVPGLKRARQHAHSGSAIQSLRTITTAEYMYHGRHKVYGTMGALNAEALVSGDLSDGYKSGYLFMIQVSADSKSFFCRATPDSDSGVLNHFYVDETGVIRGTTGAPADVTSDPIPK